MVPSFSSNKLTELYGSCCCCCTRCSGLGGGGGNAESVVSNDGFIIFAGGGGGEASLAGFSTVGFEREIFFGGFSGLTVVAVGEGVFSSNACFSGLALLLLAKAGGGDRFSLSALMAARGMRMVGISDDDEDDDDDGLLEEGDKGDGDDFSGEDDDDD